MAVNHDIRNRNIQALWPHIEAFAILIPGNKEPWWTCDDPESTLHALYLIGIAVFQALVMLKQHEDLGPTSTIPNIALTLGLLYSLDRAWLGGQGEIQLSWCSAAVRYAKLEGVSFEDIPGIDHRLYQATEPSIDKGRETSSEFWATRSWHREVVST